MVCASEVDSWRLRRAGKRQRYVKGALGWGQLHIHLEELNTKSYDHGVLWRLILDLENLSMVVMLDVPQHPSSLPSIGIEPLRVSAAHLATQADTTTPSLLVARYEQE